MSAGKAVPSAYQIARFWNKVNKTNGCWLWTASVSGSGYGRINVRGVTVYAHRLALALSGVEVPDELEVDHICRVRRCVNPDHLRPVTRSENGQNLSGAHSHGRSGVRGVSWQAARGKWRVTAVLLGRQYHGGFYDSLEEADRAAQTLRNRIYTHNQLDRKEAS